MDQQLPPDALHPNIARIAAAYDMIIDRMSSGQLTPTQARAQVEQLEARDDQGVRWSIDPDSGLFIRKTLMGDTQFDTPPVYGVQTDDAYSYSQTRGSAQDPNTRVEMFNAPDPRLTAAPVDLAGATRNGPAGPQPGDSANLFSQIPLAYRVAAVVVGLLLLLIWLLS